MGDTRRANTPDATPLYIRARFSALSIPGGACGAVYPVAHFSAAYYSAPRSLSRLL